METLPQAQLISRILLVDDERAVLSSLARTLRCSKYKLYTALNGEEALHILENETIDLIVSDMQMPKMNGAELLKKSVAISPDTVRIILTGYADLEATIKVINEGKVFSYIAKPWMKDNLISTLDRALYSKQLEHERDHLLKVTKQQNSQLANFNLQLGHKVAERTKELSEANKNLDTLNDHLKNSYETAIEVFSRMIELRDPINAGHCKRVAELARSMAIALNCEDHIVSNVYFAGMLHDIGKISLPDDEINVPLKQLNLAQRKKYYEHAVQGEMLVIPLDQTHSISHIIRHHHERFDGKGYPDKLHGDDIPLESAIIAVAEDFDEACSGLLFEEKLSVQEAKQMIIDGREQAYHPMVVDAFAKIIEKIAIDNLNSVFSEHGMNKVTAEKLIPGMVLQKDLVRDDGALLLKSETQLTTSHIDKLNQIEKNLQTKLVAWVF